MQKDLKIVFFGTAGFAVPAFKYLIQNGYNITAVITQPEKPAGRLRVIMPSPVKKAAVESGITVLEAHNLKDEDFFGKFRHLNPDICIVAAYGKIIPSRYLELPKYGFLNIHPSLLPEYRGPSPVQAAIMNGEKTGVSIMLVDEKMDHGPVLARVEFKIPRDKYFPEINDELWDMGAKLLLETLPDWIEGKIKPVVQDENRMTLSKLLTRADGKINWNKTAGEIYNQIRALNPEPGTWTTWDNKVLNIKSAEPLEIEVEPQYSPGIVVKINNSIAVATKKCYLILKQIQLEGGKEMDAKSFLNGHPDLLGSILR